MLLTQAIVEEYVILGKSTAAQMAYEMALKAQYEELCEECMIELVVLVNWTELLNFYILPGEIVDGVTQTEAMNCISSDDAKILIENIKKLCGC